MSGGSWEVLGDRCCQQLGMLPVASCQGKGCQWHLIDVTPFNEPGQPRDDLTSLKAGVGVTLREFQVGDAGFTGPECGSVSMRFTYAVSPPLDYPGHCVDLAASAPDGEVVYTFAFGP